MDNQPIRFINWQPHIVVFADDGVHVYPVPYFRDLVAQRPGTEPLPEAVIRAIVHDWLIMVETFGTFVPADWVEW